MFQGYSPWIPRAGRADEAEGAGPAISTSTLSAAVPSAAMGTQLLRLLLLALGMLARRCAGGTGFCLDLVPPALAGPGYTAAPSALVTQSLCEAAGHEWCPLSDETKSFEYTDEGSGATAPVGYYWWSACCTGRQGQRLNADSAGLPSCEAGMPATECSRRHWQTKLEADLLGDDYNSQVAPGTPKTDPHTYGGFPRGGASVSCACAATDPGCAEPGLGDNCLLCETDAACSEDGAKVEMSISFFKITSVDLRSSELDFSAWLRQIWTDPRLAYDYQCYGGLDYFEVQGSAGSLEDSRIWTPDIELYNHRQPIWGDSSLGARLAIIYSCWDGAPTRGGCGQLPERSALVRARVCRLVRTKALPFCCASTVFLSKTVPFRAVPLSQNRAIDGRYQDLHPRGVDGGVNWVDKPVEEGQSKSLAGLTAGSSFEDYRIAKVGRATAPPLHSPAPPLSLPFAEHPSVPNSSILWCVFACLVHGLSHQANVTREVAFFDCCPHSPYPTLLYRIIFQRSKDYYTSKLVVPPIVLSLLSFITFFMSPETGERLGFGITMILAMLALDITASEMMPVCANPTVLPTYC
eukprot:SAG22_NODE_6_length_41368_cov_49.702222_16_plen_579_part_00